MIKEIVKFLKDKMIFIVLGLILVSVGLGIQNRDAFLSLKSTLPIALFLMLYQPMVYLNLTSIVKKRSSIKAKYLAILTVFYVGVYPLLTYGLLAFWSALMPNTDPLFLSGLVVISLAPLPSSAPAFTNMAGGKFQLTLIGVIWTFILSLFVMPLYAKLILNTIIEVPVEALVNSLIYYIIIPLIVGQATKYGILHFKDEKALEETKLPLSILSLMGLYWMVIVVFGINAMFIVKNPSIIVIGAVIMNLYFLLRMGLSYFTGKAAKIPLDRIISLVYSSGSNMTIATAIAIAVFGPLAAVGTTLGGPFSDMILMILLIRVFEKLKLKEAGLNITPTAETITPTIITEEK